MNHVIEFNPILLSTVLAWLLAQILKLIICLINTRKFQISKLFDPGGMPSSHTSSVAALTTGVLIFEGINTPLFAVVFVFTSIVIYDATGVRQSAGKQGALLNRIIPELMHGKLVKQFDYQMFRELMGHNWLEVTMGAILGVVTSLIWAAIFQPDTLAELLFFKL